MFDYSYAGYRFGAEPLPVAQGTAVEASAHGVVADDGLDDSAALDRALVAARAIAGPVVLQLPAGRIQISKVHFLDRSDLVLRGRGEGESGTELYMPRPLRLANERSANEELRAYMLRESKFQREPDQGIDNVFSIYSWSGGFLHVGRPQGRPVSYDPALDRPATELTTVTRGERGSASITVANGGALRAGQIIRLQWFAAQGRESSIIHSIYGDTDLNVGSHHWSFPNRAAVVQSTRVLAVRGNRVTLGDPLLHAVSATQPAQVVQWDPLTNVGIESLRITFPETPWLGHHLEDGWNGIYFTDAFDGWVRNLVISNADAGILTDDAANLTLANIRTVGTHRAHYAVHVGAVHNVLVQDVRVDNPVIHPLTFNTRSTRSVYSRALVTSDGQFDHHSGSNHANLFEQVTMHIRPRQDASGWRWRLWEGGGAPYWRPGHGRGNTAWNVEIVVPDAVPAGATVTLFSGVEGPGKTIVGMRGNRRLAVEYNPQPVVQALNAAPSVPSLYAAQLAARMRARRR